MWTNLWTVKMSDWQRALVVAVIAAPIGLLYDWATQPQFILTLKALLKGAIAGGAGYMIKNFLTGAGGSLLSNK